MTSKHRINHIHIMGAPGSGVSTLGKALAKVLAYTFLDTDDFVWFTEDLLPYRRRRNKEHRIQQLAAGLQANSSWILSGSLCGWGDVFISEFDALIYLSADKDVRLERIAQRELERYGAEALSQDGSLHSVFETFKTWAGDYETRQDGIRSEIAELTWIAEKIHCPVLFLNSLPNTTILAQKALDFLQNLEN